MIYFVLLIYWISLVGGLKAIQSRVCYKSFSSPYTGYRVECRIELKTWKYEYHLVSCHDNILIYDLSLNDTIPWTERIIFSGNETSSHLNQLILSRSKAYALRNTPLYVPNSFIGALFHEGTPKSSFPLFADNFLQNWLEMTYKLDFILHIPIMSTPNIDNKNYQHLDHWDTKVSISESYKYKRHAFKSFHSSVSKFSANMTQKLNSISKSKLSIPKLSLVSSLSVVKFLILSKALPEQAFLNLFASFDQATKILD